MYLTASASSMIGCFGAVDLDAEGTPLMIGRRAAGFYLGLDETIWLVSDGRIVRWRNERPDVFAVEASAANEWLALAPLTDGGLLIVGHDKAGVLSLTRLADSGGVVWYRDDLPAAQAKAARAEVIAEADGTMYLYTASLPTGEGGAG